MEVGKLLDLAIKESETNGAKKDAYYEVKATGKRYKNYIDNASWQAFVREMWGKYQKIYESFLDGDGGELGVKKSKKACGVSNNTEPIFDEEEKKPPKMASYGSSSRMLYLLARGKEGFQFEKKLPTGIGRGKANLDGFLIQDGARYYIEAKRREPYSEPSFTMSDKYQKLYEDFIFPVLGDECKLTKVKKRDDKGKGKTGIKVRFAVKDKEITRFDIKQMICHMLGIATEQIENPCEERIKFIYFLYNPEELDFSQFKEEDEARKTLFSIYETEIDECDSVPFAELYKAIVQYLTKDKPVLVDVDKIANNFSFERLNQKDFEKLLEE